MKPTDRRLEWAASWILLAIFYCSAFVLLFKLQHVRARLTDFGLVLTLGAAAAACAGELVVTRFHEYRNHRGWLTRSRFRKRPRVPGQRRNIATVAMIIRILFWWIYIFYLVEYPTSEGAAELQRTQIYLIDWRVTNVLLRTPTLAIVVLLLYAVAFHYLVVRRKVLRGFMAMVVLPCLPVGLKVLDYEVGLKRPRPELIARHRTTTSGWFTDKSRKVTCSKLCRKPLTRAEDTRVDEDEHSPTELGKLSEMLIIQA